MADFPLRGGGSPPLPPNSAKLFRPKHFRQEEGGVPRWRKKSPQRLDDHDEYILQRDKDKEILPQYHPRPPPQPIRASPPPLAKP